MIEAALLLAASAGCAPLGLDRHALEALAAEEFVIDDPARRRAFLGDLSACVGAADPFLRDAIGYGGAAAILRRDGVDDAAVVQLAGELLDLLDGPDGEAGFTRPFAALLLSEVARHDLLHESLPEDLRERLIDSGSRYLRGVTDYRGFHEGEGWRHGVAHGADLLMQLSRRPDLSAEERRGIEAAVMGQVAPRRHFYIYGEPGRLARPLLFSVRGGGLTDETEAELRALGDPAPFESWGDAFASQEGLARIHNTRAFLAEIVLRTEGSDDPELRDLRAAASETLRALP